MFAEFFKESDRVHACPSVSTPQQREECTHQPRGAVATDTEDSNSDDKYIVMPPLIYPEESNDKESPSNLPSVDPTPEPGPPSEKPTKEPASEPDYDALSEPSAPTREGSMGHLDLKDIVRYHKESYPPRFATLEKRTKEDP